MQRVQEVLGLSRSTVTRLISAGFVAPARGPRGEYLFGFHDLLLLRTAHGLQRANIPPRKIVRAMQRLREQLPESIPLTGLRIGAIGADVAVRKADGQWETDTGQLLMDFEVAERDGSLTFIDSRRVAEPAPRDGPDTWFARGETQETSNPPAAEAAYANAIAVAPNYVDAYLNLGAMLCDSGRADEAIALYESGLRVVSGAALLHFNLAIALEDNGRLAEAVVAYERCIAIDPHQADAHFNLGRLQEKLGDPKSALRHFSEYRRQTS